MLIKSGLTAGAIALMLGAAIVATSPPAQARGGYHGISTGRTGAIVGARFEGRQYRFGEEYRRFDRDGDRRFGFRHWRRYTWFRHFHHRWFHRYS